MNLEQVNALAYLKEATEVVSAAFDVRILTTAEHAALVAQVALMMRLEDLRGCMPVGQPWRF